MFQMDGSGQLQRLHGGQVLLPLRIAVQLPMRVNFQMVRLIAKLHRQADKRLMTDVHLPIQRHVTEGFIKRRVDR